MNRTVVVFAVVVVIGASTAGVLALDADGDGLGSVSELGHETDPLVADSDGDGVDDGTELEAGTDPVDPDTDDDGLSDGAERDDGTDPTDADTDDDGVEDSAEVDSSSDPNRGDTDGDGLDDGEEVAAGTDVTVADTDGDGLSDGVEARSGPDPTSADTDGDGLDDRVEMEGETHATSADSDSDGLDDGREVELGTNPRDDDTDGDGFSDGAEVDRSEILPEADPLTRDVYVEVDSFPSVELPKLEGRKVVREFRDAPVGPAGSEGWNLHLVYDDPDVDSCGCAIGMHDTRSGDRGRYYEYREEYFDRQGMGYHYLLVVPSVDDYRMKSGYVRIGQATRGDMIVERRNRASATGSIFMHELGHSLGLSSRDFDGIDSDRYTPGEYPSVMNYELHSEYYGFSSSEPFDDWARLEADFYVPSTDRLYDDE